MRNANRIVRRALCIAMLALAPLGATAQKLAADTPSTTSAGNQFVAPAGWSIAVKGALMVLEAPEGGSQIVLMDVSAPRRG